MNELENTIEDAEEFGRETGECGICGRPLDATDREVGICHFCVVDMDDEDNMGGSKLTANDVAEVMSDLMNENNYTPIESITSFREGGYLTEDAGFMVVINNTRYAVKVTEQGRDR